MTNRLAVLLVVMGLAGCASAPPVTTASEPQGGVYAYIPAELEGFKLSERTVLRGAPADSAFRFRDGSRTILSVFIYDVDAGAKVGDDPNEWTVREGAKFDVVQQMRANAGAISAYAPVFSDTTRFAVGTRDILEHAVTLTTRFRNGTVAVEMQYLYLIDGKFVKVRGTMPDAGWQQSRVPAFARALARRMAGGA